MKALNKWVLTSRIKSSVDACWRLRYWRVIQFDTGDLLLQPVDQFLEPDIVRLYINIEIIHRVGLLALSGLDVYNVDVIILRNENKKNIGNF